MRFDPNRMDVEEDYFTLMFYIGAAVGGLIEVKKAEAAETRAALTGLAPLLAALGVLARRHPEEALELYARCRQEPGPFGQPPVGLPNEREKQ